MSVDAFPLYLPLLALGVDLAVGDPGGWPHPVRLLGLGADRLEAFARKAPGGLVVWGAVCALGLAFVSGAVAWGLSSLPLLGWAASLYLAYAGRLPEARDALSMLVSRETSEMDEDAVCRALAETVSENLGDGLVAPFFYLALAGPGGLWAYKAVSTLDSMWGYRTERWRELGRVAARADDVLAWLPSRLAGVALLVCGRVMFGRRVSFRAVRADAGKTESPNAGWPMAAAAWVMGAHVGGPAVYFGRAKDKPRLGPEGGRWDVRRLRGLLRLTAVSGVACAVVLWAVFVWL